MKWKKERDLLIAQTFAFVQSVTGKKPDLEATPAQSPVETGAAVTSAEAAELTGEPPPQGTTAGIPFPIPRKIVTSEIRTEMQARVANFRAHQQRFDREREAHFSATLAKIRATIGDNSAPLR